MRQMREAPVCGTDAEAAAAGNAGGYVVVRREEHVSPPSTEGGAGEASGREARLRGTDVVGAAPRPTNAAPPRSPPPGAWEKTRPFARRCARRVRQSTRARRGASRLSRPARNSASHHQHEHHLYRHCARCPLRVRRAQARFVSRAPASPTLSRRCAAGIRAVRLRPGRRAAWPAAASAHGPIRRRQFAWQPRRRQSEPKLPRSQQQSRRRRRQRQCVPAAAPAPPLLPAAVPRRLCRDARTWRSSEWP